MPNDEDLHGVVLSEAQGSKFTVHPRGDKMYQDVKRQYWWVGMKKDIAVFYVQVWHSSAGEGESSEITRDVASFFHF